jgi:hypothetical protein
VDNVGSSSLIAAEFAADFPVGSIYSISVSLEADPQGLHSGAGPCLPPCYVIAGGDILTPVPEPASRSILGAALGIFLMARRVARRATKGPSEDLAGA